MIRTRATCPECGRVFDLTDEGDADEWFSGHDCERPAPITVEVDCHAYPWHEPDPNYPECGPDNLVRMAEEYGVLIAFLPDHWGAGWAWWYTITGPRAHVVRLLAVEYGPGEAEAEEMVAGMLGELT